MPIYEYYCPTCHGKFELLRPLSRASEPVSCPHCHNGAQRVISTFASFSKGSGGETRSVGGGGGCSGCSGSSCATCH